MTKIKQVKSFLLVFFLLVSVSFNLISQVSVNTLPYNYNQDFGTTPINNWINNNTFAGWYNDGGPFVSEINITNGAPVNGGGLYAYTCNGSNDRKIGFRPSNGSGNGPCNNQTCGHALGLRVQNNSGQPVTSIEITFDAYQLSHVQDGGNVNTIFFDYRIGNNFLTVPLSPMGWTNVPSLQYVGPNVNNNCGANQTGGLPCNTSDQLTACLSVNLAAGEEIMLRWTDNNNSCNDPHFAIDNVEIDFYGSCTQPILDPVADVNDCVSYTLPPISGNNLSGNEAYFTGSNGTGTQYNPGDVISTIGSTTLYVYDEAGVMNCNNTTCFDETSFTITLTNGTTPTFNAIPDVCEGATPPTLPTTSNNGISGSWSPAVNTNNAGTQTYTFTPDPGQCGATATLDITVLPPDDASFFYNNPEYCQNGAVPTPVITGVNGGSFSATPGLYINASTGAIDASISSTGNHTVTYSVNQNCPNSDDFDVEIIEPQTAEFQYNGSNSIILCQTASNPTLQMLNGGTSGDFTSIPAGLSLDANSGAIDLTQSQPGVYDITNTVNDQICNVTVTHTVTVEVQEAPTAGFTGDYSICTDASLPDVEIQLTGNQPWEITYQHNGNPQTITTTNNPYFIENAALGTYELISVNDGQCNGTVDTQTITVSEGDGPEVNELMDLQMCSGDQLTIPPFQSNTPGATFEWNNTGVDIGFGLNGNGSIPTFTGNNITSGSDVATIEVQATSNGCAGAVETFEIELFSKPEVNFTADQLSGCAPLSVSFEDLTNGANTSLSCEWNFGNGSTKIDCDSTYFMYQHPGCYDVSLTITSAQGCDQTEIYSSFICVNPPPKANFVYSPNKVSVEDTEITFENTSENATTYAWIFDDFATSGQENPIIQFPEEAGTYLTELIAYSDDGCTDTAYTDVLINEDLIFYVPNTFTPDGDGYNEHFIPVMTAGYDAYDYELLIFNRWGEIVFESRNAQIGWAGTYRGRAADEGTYVWKITTKLTIYDDHKTFTGHINLLR